MLEALKPTPWVTETFRNTKTLPSDLFLEASRPIALGFWNKHCRTITKVPFRAPHGSLFASSCCCLLPSIWHCPGEYLKLLTARSINQSDPKHFETVQTGLLLDSQLFSSTSPSESLPLQKWQLFFFLQEGLTFYSKKLLEQRRITQRNNNATVYKCY